MAAPYYGQQQQHNNTVVVVNQPTSSTPQIREWHSELFDCFDDMRICLCGTFLGICLAIQTSQKMGESCWVPCCVSGYLVALRTKMRTQEHIVGSICKDCLITSFCGPCALCQLAREVKTVQQVGMAIHRH